MKRNLLILVCALLTLPGSARDFKYPYKGKTLTYTVTDEEAKTVCTKAGTDSSTGNNVSGDLIIPSTVVANQVTYTVTEIGYRGFADCPNLTSVIIPNTVTSIGDGAFNNSENLATLIIPNSVVKIGAGICCFNTALTSIVIPESVTTIGESAFAYCSKLNTIWLPGSLISMGGYTFDLSPSIESVYYNTDDPLEGYRTMFYSRAYSGVLYVPSESAVEKCKKIHPWMDFKNIEVYDFSQSGVDEINTDREEINLPIFDLFGRKVANPQKGQLYIQNGKKFIQR